MVRLGRWKSGLALLLLLHLLVHPSTHVQRFSALASTGLQHNLTRVDAADPDDVCSLCRVANSLHPQLPTLTQEKLLFQAASQRVETSAAPRTVERSQTIPRAPPASIAL